MIDNVQLGGRGTELYRKNYRYAESFLGTLVGKCLKFACTRRDYFVWHNRQPDKILTLMFVIIFYFDVQTASPIIVVVNEGDSI